MFDNASLTSQRSSTTRLMESSLSAGWTSTLVERHRSEERSRDFDLLPTPDLHFALILEGEHRLAVLRNGNWPSAQYHPGSMGMLAGGEGGRMRSTCESYVEIAHLYLPISIVTEAFEVLRRAGQRTEARPLSLLRFNDPVIASTTRALLAAAACGAPNLYAEQAMHWLALHLLTRHGGADRRLLEADRQHLSDARLSRAIALVRTRYAEPMSLDMLALEAGVSKFHFSRLFRERTGMSPHAFITDERVAAARDLLLDTGLSIFEVARQVGYASAQQFSVAFKRRQGVTPTAFRQRRKGPDQSLS